MRHLSVFKTDGEALAAIAEIHIRGGGWYDLDCTYSKGIFYTDIPQPRIKSDLIPLFDDVIEADSQKLDFLQDASIGSVVFDPPFLFRNRKAENNDKMCARFSYFRSYDELLQMYQNSLIAIWKKLKPGGILCFKCQDMTDGKFYCTHNDIINFAVANGYTLNDIALKVTSQKLQRDAKQQNCVAKVHSYWLIFRKTNKGGKT